jgi:predicted PolB exonuclease-like 3'-5' exonuclease
MADKLMSPSIPRGYDITAKEYTDDPQEKIGNGAVKYDGGKAPIYRGAVSYFPRAIEAVSAVSLFGATKYAWKGWENVDDGFNRYSDAMVRHLTYEGKGEVLDSGSGLTHAAHAAWNSLARLELLLREREDNGKYCNT